VASVDTQCSSSNHHHHLALTRSQVDIYLCCSSSYRKNLYRKRMYKNLNWTKKLGFLLGNPWNTMICQNGVTIKN
jgi:hypothetical protein